MAMATMDQPVGRHEVSNPHVRVYLVLLVRKLRLICLSKLKTIFSAFHIRGRGKHPLSGGTVSENWWQKWYEDRKREVSKQKVTVKSWASSCVFTQLCLQSPLLFYWLHNSRKENSRGQLLSCTNQSLSNTRSKDFRGCNFILQSVGRFPLVYKLFLRGLTKSKLKEPDQNLLSTFGI